MPMPIWRQLKLVSGGQTGVDRAALDVALYLELEQGGWCPRGRRAEDGKIPKVYDLQETPESDYATRTEQNVRDSDGTLILHAGPLSGGTALTVRLLRQYRRPMQLVNLDEPISLEVVREWILSHGIQVLNVAGPRESTSPGISRRAEQFLVNLLSGDVDGSAECGP